MKITFNSPKIQIPVGPKLVRGKAVLNPYSLYKMKKSGINQIIDLRNSAHIKKRIEKFFCNILGIKYVNCKYSHRLSKLPCRQFFENINQLISKNNGKSYIHCQYGKRRTGIAVAIYEKECLHKPKKDVIDNLFTLGFNEFICRNSFRGREKYLSIIKDFLKQYYPV